ncbi:MAG TPA: hypothetical protein VFQ40_00340, partial [Actinomycetota bacterium]|nr:hypothetical protein [Actinomycetota bacterium]
MRRAEVRIALAVGASLALGLLVAAFRPAEVHGLGWDAPGYVVQMRAAALGVLDLPGSRPGVAATGAFLDGVGVLPIGLGPAGLSVAAAVCVGLGGAAALRRVWAVPAWGLGATVVLVATWGGTTRLASGYLANLVALTLFVLGVALALAPTARWPAVSAAFAACLLAHPGAAPAWAAILLAWAVLEGVAREDPDPSRAFSALSAFLAAAVVVTGAVAWRLGLSIEELQDLTVVRERFDERAAELVAWIGPGLSIAMIGAGIAIAALVGEGPRSRPAVRLGIVWMLVCALGLPLLALAPAVPGHRLLLLALPVPLLGAR